MQHILNIAFDFDDDKVRQLAEKNVENNMDAIIKNIIIDQIAPLKYSYYGNKETRDWDTFGNRINDGIKQFADEHKDEIIDKAAWLLCESYKRTKAWKDKAGEVTQ